MTKIPIEQLLERAVLNQLETCDEDTVYQLVFPIEIDYTSPIRNSPKRNREFECSYQEFYGSSWKVLESYAVMTLFTSQFPILTSFYNLVYVSTGSRKFWDVFPTESLDNLFEEENQPKQKRTVINYIN